GAPRKPSRCGSTMVIPMALSTSGRNQSQPRDPAPDREAGGRSRRLRLGFAVASLLGLIAAACGSDGSGGGERVAAVGSAPAGEPNEPVASTTTTTVMAPPAAPVAIPAPALSSAPVLVDVRAVATARQGSGSPEYWVGTITVTFDRPVNLGPATLAPLYLVVYGADPACDGPDGNGQRVISGSGTPTLTLDASSLGAPVSYVTLAPGFVTAVGSGTPSGPVGCTAVPTAT
ncbi:MAG: hypothetical protein ABIW46_08460, partial [Acidimicrobiales bacterium]